MRFDIITIFPNIFSAKGGSPPAVGRGASGGDSLSYFDYSILRRAQKKKLVTIRSHDIRKFSRDSHKKVDDKPYGGGAGMVLAAEPILRAVDAISKKNRSTKYEARSTKIIILSAKGKQFAQKMAYEWAKKYNQLILISGRYEGIDERVSQALKYIIRKDNISSYSKKYYHSISVSVDEISIGPYVLTDGDAAAMVIISAVARLIPGVIKLESLAEESHWSDLLKKEKNASAKSGSLEYPHYTRPEAFVWKGKTYRVPKILLSGNHKKIQLYREGKRKKAR